MPQLSFTPSEYKKIFDRVRSYVLKNNGTIENVHDVLQGGILILFEKVDDHQFKLRCTFEDYLFGICKNIWIQELQLRISQFEMTSLENLLDEQPEEIIELKRKELLIKIPMGNMKNLTAKCQEIFKYRAEGLTCKEMATKMNLGNDQISRNKLLN